MNNEEPGISSFFMLRFLFLPRITLASETPRASVAPSTTPEWTEHGDRRDDGMEGRQRELDAQATAAATAAANHRRATRRTGTPVRPMRRFNVWRSSANSTHPATPADAVSPATPHADRSRSIARQREREE